MRKTWLVLLTLNGGKHVMYVVSAVNADIAIDAAVRSHKLADPKATFRDQFAYETSLEAPLKVLED